MMTMNSQTDDQMVLISHYFPDGIYGQLVDEQGAAGKSKPRRSRKKNKGGEGGMVRKRKLSDEQVNMLEQSFGSEQKLESERKDRLASELGLDPRQVAVWFQNKRARWKSKKLEEEYSKLKSDHETAVLEKCRLEAELLKLKEQLHEAEKAIQRLTERRDGFSCNSPTSSFSMEAIDPPFLGEFGMEGLDNAFNMQENINHVHGFGWDNLYYM